MLFQIRSYLNFLWKSSNEHGVHSPFVFDFVTKCLYDKEKYREYDFFKKYRKVLLSDENVINVTDFGAGSRVFKSSKRKIADIAATAGISSERSQMLFRITKYFQPQNILEIGTSLGLATAAFSSGNQSAEITTIEGCPETAAAAKRTFEKFKLSNIKAATGEFTEVLLGLQQSFDMIYFDGNHQKDATLQYFNLLLPTANNNSVWIFDDIHWSPGMESAWETIKQNPLITVTIDTFQWGIVFFRKEQEKENFTIRV
ncbi:MAG TPA: class I SAM-dependent methyltransferase [Flavobacterium sp.]|jgi:predicted O-methyltransferase YrrM